MEFRYKLLKNHMLCAYIYTYMHMGMYLHTSYRHRLNKLSQQIEESNIPR